MDKTFDVTVFAEGARMKFQAFNYKGENMSEVRAKLIKDYNAAPHQVFVRENGFSLPVRNRF